jgi:nonsense-mediated mRNA decay protein 3
LSICLKKLRGL